MMKVDSGPWDEFIVMLNFFLFFNVNLKKRVKQSDNMPLNKHQKTLEEYKILKIEMYLIMCLTYKVEFFSMNCEIYKQSIKQTNKQKIIF